MLSILSAVVILSGHIVELKIAFEILGLCKQDLSMALDAGLEHFSFLLSHLNIDLAGRSCLVLGHGYYYLDLIFSLGLDTENNVTVALSRVVQLLHEPLAMVVDDIVDGGWESI